jgi:ribonuclease HI
MNKAIEPKQNPKTESAMDQTGMGNSPEICVYIAAAHTGDECDACIGGWGAVIHRDGKTKSLSGYEFFRTIERIELRAVIRALTYLGGEHRPIRIVS